jgi:hypothetical protein
VLIRMPGRALVLALAICVLDTDRSLVGQAVTRVASKVTCPTCVIEIRKVATIGGPNDTVAFEDGLFNVARDSRGRFHVGPAKSGLIAVYDSVGRFIRTVGRIGKGPGEFQHVIGFGIGHDTLIVLDHSGTIVLSPDYSHVRLGGRPYGQATRVVLLPGGSLAVAKVQIRDKQPIELFDGKGKVVRSFGNAKPETDPLQEIANYRGLFQGKGGRLWVTRWSAYVLEEWDTTGTHLRSFARDAEWFRSATKEDLASMARGRSKDQDPISSLWAVHQDPDGMVWTFSNTADPNWKSAPLQLTQGEGGSFKSLAPENYAKYWDTVVEVLDPGTGHLLAVKRLDAQMRAVQGGPFLFNFRYDRDGETYIDIWELKLKRK